MIEVFAGIIGFIAGFALCAVIVSSSKAEDKAEQIRKNEWSSEPSDGHCTIVATLDVPFEDREMKEMAFEELNRRLFEKMVEESKTQRIIEYHSENDTFRAIIHFWAMVHIGKD